MLCPTTARSWGLRTAVPLLAALAATVALAPAAAPAAAALPSVNMDVLVRAAELDPARSDMVHTAGATDSVKAVENVLANKGYLARSYVDGYWGTKTVEAWGKWERHNGENSVYGNNGMPGLGELQDLAAGNFTLTHTFGVGNRSTFRGVVLNARTIAMVRGAEARAGIPTLTLIQGSYCGGSCATDSAGTHSGGGAIDISVNGMSATTINNVVGALRAVGFAAWHRVPPQFPAHIHVMAISDYQMSWAAYGIDTAPSSVTSGGWGGNCQIFEYKFFQDGLGGCDDRPPSGARNRNLTTWEEYKATH